MKDSPTKVKDLDPVIEAYKKDIDVTLIRENLRLTVDQRFQQLMKLQQFARRSSPRRKKGTRKVTDFERRSESANWMTLSKV